MTLHFLSRASADASAGGCAMERSCSHDLPRRKPSSGRFLRRENPKWECVEVRASNYLNNVGGAALPTYQAALSVDDRLTLYCHHIDVDLRRQIGSSNLHAPQFSVGPGRRRRSKSFREPQERALAQCCANRRYENLCFGAMRRASPLIGLIFEKIGSTLAPHFDSTSANASGWLIPKVV